MPVFQVFYQFVLVRLAALTEKLQGSGFGYFSPHDRFFTLCQLQHLLFNTGKVAFTDNRTCRRHHIVIKTVFYGRTDTELHTRIKFLHSLSHQVSGSMPESMLSLCVLPLVKHHGSIFVNRTVQLDRLTIHSASQHVLCQSGRNTLSNL